MATTVKTALTGGESTSLSSHNIDVVADVKVVDVIQSSSSSSTFPAFPSSKTTKTVTEESREKEEGGKGSTTNNNNNNINSIEDGFKLITSEGVDGDDEELEGEKTPLPNFCVEGSGQGDCTVTVINSCLVDSCGLSSERSNATINGDDVTEDCSAPISVGSEENMKLSLVSWYSEPEETTRDCCKTNLILRHQQNTTTTHKTTCFTDNTPTSTSISNNKNTPNSSRCTKSSCCGEVDVDEFLSLDSSTAHCHHDDGEDNNSNEKTPMRSRNKGNNSSKPLKNSNNNSNSSSSNNNNSCSGSHKLKMHVQLFEQNSQVVENGKVTSSNSTSHGNKLECPRCCARRSKSGYTTPATVSKTPSRRVVQSSKSSQELKKPIKSILRSSGGSHGSRSNSGSEKQSSMDSLGSVSGIAACNVMTRSDGCGNGNRTKFNFNSGSFSSSSNYSPDEKTSTTLSKLKRIEKYATLRLGKTRRRPLDFSSEHETETCEPNCCGNKINNGTHSPRNNNNNNKNSNSSVNHSEPNTDIMSKSMSFLEKASSHHHHHHQHGNSDCGGNSSSTLKRQGSLRIRKPSPMYEPSGTRTSVLRMQKMQEAKNKTTGMNNFSFKGTNNSSSSSSSHPQNTNTNHHHHHHQHNGSNHSGSGESIHHNKDKQQQQSNVGCSAKVFTKLSSASGQTASSALKRIKQERGVQTDQHFSSSFSVSSPTTEQSGSFRISPVPTFDQETDTTEQIKNLSLLAQRYRTTALRFQHEYEKSEQRNQELLKQLQEVQSESTEMIEFLQAEKSTLAESLAEVESEGKKLREQVELSKTDTQSRCSSLVRLSEQHKQEALTSQALLSRLEAKSNAIISKQSGEISDAALEIQQTRQRIVTLIEKLLKTYKVPRQVLASATATQSDTNLIDESDLNSSLLLPLVNALMNVFPLVSSTSASVSDNNDKLSTELAATNSSTNTTAISTTTVTTSNNQNNGTELSPIKSILKNSNSTSSATSTTKTTAADSLVVVESAITASEHDNSLHNLSQAILEREAAEQSLEQSTQNDSEVKDGLENIRDGLHLPIRQEIEKLNNSLAKLVMVIRIIVVQCDKKVSGVASNILQCLRSMEEEKSGTIPQIMNVQKSLEAWNCFENGQNHS